MKTKLFAFLLLAPLALAVPAAAEATPDEPGEAAPAGTPAAEAKPAALPAADEPAQDAALLRRPSFAETWIKGRFAVGPAVSQLSVRNRHVPYDPEQERNFLGNINKMEEDGCTGAGISVRYGLLSWLAVEASGPGRADLKAWNRDGESCDGTLRLRTWSARLLLRWPTDDGWFSPYAGFGVERVSASFEHANWWHYGWSSPQDYETFGNGSKEPHHSASRRMELSSPGVAPVVALGATIRLHENAELDLFGSWTDSDDVDVVFYRTDGRLTRRMRTGAFPSEHLSYGIALRYVF